MVLSARLISLRMLCSGLGQIFQHKMGAVVGGVQTGGGGLALAEAATVHVAVLGSEECHLVIHPLQGVVNMPRGFGTPSLPVGLARGQAQDVSADSGAPRRI